MLDLKAIQEFIGTFAGGSLPRARGLLESLRGVDTHKMLWELWQYQRALALQTDHSLDPTSKLRELAKILFGDYSNYLVRPGLTPLIHNYGSKWRLAPRYPQPQHKTIIESFCGGAGYSLTYPGRQVKLYDLDPIVCGVWEYLIKSPAEEILKLPLEVSDIRDLDICQEARHLIGYWLNSGRNQPANRPSIWNKNGTRPTTFWGESVRARIASQVDKIRHWQIFNKSYEAARNQTATWFIDPPYSAPCGKAYRFKFDDYPRLAGWCQTRRGQVIVCEQEGADWLPFQFFHESLCTRSGGAKSPAKYSREVIWTAG